MVNYAIAFDDDRCPLCGKQLEIECCKNRLNPKLSYREKYKCRGCGTEFPIEWKMQVSDDQLEYVPHPLFFVSSFESFINRYAKGGK